MAKRPIFSLGAILLSVLLYLGLGSSVVAATEANGSAFPVDPGIASTSGPAAAFPTMKLISREVPSYASSGNGLLANNRNYHVSWRSSGVPATLAYDLGTVPPENRQSLYLVWYNDATYGYDHSGGPGYNNVGSYTIEANAADGGGAVPTAGWVVMERVTNNVLHSRDHVVKFAGYNWIRLNASSADGSPSNWDVAIKMDVYDASHGVTDGWLFAGDSITAGAMGHSDLSSASDSFTNQVGDLVGVFPAQENAGMPGWTSETMRAHLADWLKLYNGKFVAISLGTNDAAGGTDSRAFHANMAALVEMVLAAAKVPLIPTIPWSRDPAHAENMDRLNAAIEKLYREYPGLIRGPDLFSLFRVLAPTEN